MSRDPNSDPFDPTDLLLAARAVRTMMRTAEALAGYWGDDSSTVMLLRGVAKDVTNSLESETSFKQRAVIDDRLDIEDELEDRLPEFSLKPA